MLKLNKSTMIGLYAMMELAREPGAMLTAGEIADRFHASRHHLVKVLQQLARAGLVESERGAAGGHRLSQDPKSVTLAQIVEVFEGPHQEESLCLLIHPEAKCAGRESAGSASPPGMTLHGRAHCALHPLFHELEEMIAFTLQYISLTTLLSRNRPTPEGPTPQSVKK